MSAYLEMLADLGMTGAPAAQGREILTRCPFHDDRRPSFYVNTSNGVWFCQSQCGGGTFPELVERLVKLGWRPVPQEQRYVPPSTFSGTGVEALEQFRQRGFTIDMLTAWGMQWDDEMKGTAIPIRNTSGEHASTVWRMPNGSIPKYRYAAGFEKSNCLFPLDRLAKFAREGGGKLKVVVLVEGTLDAIWGCEGGMPTASILGSFLSDWQVEALRRMVQRIVLCFDNDEAGRMATELATTRLRAVGLWVSRVRLPNQYKDIQEVPLPLVGGVLMDTTESFARTKLAYPRYARWNERRPMTEKSIWRYS